MASRPDSSTSIIVLSPAEVAFLTKVTTDNDRHARIAAEVRGALNHRLLGLSKPEDLEMDRYVLNVTGPEIEQLHLITKAAYSFITEGERRARLVLREKMAVASDELGIKLR